MRMSAVMNVVEDEAGAVLPFTLCLQEPEKVRPTTSILLKSAVCIVKEPYFKVGTNGKYVIRVDQPTDIVWLPEDDSRIPSKWRKTGDPKTAEQWKTLGNEMVGKGDFYQAVEM